VEGMEGCFCGGVEWRCVFVGFDHIAKALWEHGDVDVASTNLLE